MTDLALYTVAQQYRDLLNQLMENGADEQTMKDTLEAEGWPLEEKAQQVAFYIRNLESSADQIDAAIVSMEERATAMRKHAERIRAYLHDNLEHAKVKKIDSTMLKIQLDKKPPVLVIDNEEQIPAQFFRYPDPPPIPDPAPDKKAILAALKAGTDVPGCRMVTGTKLVIK